MSTSMFNLRLDNDVRRRMKIQADKTGRTLSNLIHLACTEYLERNEVQTDEQRAANIDVQGIVTRYIKSMDNIFTKDGDVFLSDEDIVSICASNRIKREHIDKAIASGTLVVGLYFDVYEGMYYVKNREVIQ